MTGRWGTTPAASVATECTRRGRVAVIGGCVELLDGRPVDDGLVRALGGPGADAVLAGREGGPTGSWPRVWAARGLLHEWDDTATAAIIAALADPSWRVREMAVKVVARHRVGDGLAAAVGLREDAVARVRAAAERAVALLTTAGT